LPHCGESNNRFNRSTRKDFSTLCLDNMARFAV
jgi:hypothetical protein